MNKINSGMNSRKLWDIKGSFGEFCAEASTTEKGWYATSSPISVSTSAVTDKNGVRTSKTVIKNISDAEISITCASDRLVFNGGEYSVYTQFNGWQNESIGGWQPLITTVTAESPGVRSAESAAPFLVLWNEQTGRGTAFHLLSQASWRIKATRRDLGGTVAVIEVELGLLPDNLCLKLAPGGELELPEIICYDVRNRVDMDCYKLHENINKRFPRRSLPVIFNTWLCRFDMINYENLENQIAPAAEIGADYFVIDAGWFGGKGQGWWKCKGDWEEQPDGNLSGRMAELADSVRAAGMGFGLWFEIESASPGSDIVNNHPEYFRRYNGEYLLDFANPTACEYILETLCRMIEKYGISFIKFDFNQNVRVDEQQSAFKYYIDGYNNVIKTLRARHPEIYLENCASGGIRMSLGNLEDFDSFWFSDNQGVGIGMRIFKDSIKRMPPTAIERWATIRSLCDFKPVYGKEEGRELILSTDNAVWSRVVSWTPEMIRGFLTGSAFGISCDLNELSTETRTMLREHIAAHKALEEFYKNAVCRILTDTESMLVLEFSDTAFLRIELLVFVGKKRQSEITIYPAVDIGASYRMDGAVISGKMLDIDGIEVSIKEDYQMIPLTLVKNKDFFPR